MFMNTNLHLHPKIKFNNVNANSKIPATSMKTGLKRPMNMAISGNMVGRVHFSNPGCGSCGK